MKSGKRWSLCRRALLTVWTILLALGTVSAYAEPLTLPSNITRIQEEAFSGCTGITEVVIPPSVISIDTAAFRDCASLREITIPATVSMIAADALTGCSTTLWLHCAPGSKAVSYARAHQIDYDAQTRYRALIIGQNYSDTGSVLYGPDNDTRAMRYCLTEMTSTEWTVTQKTNLTASGILNAIRSVFGSANENDVSLLYYSGHGTDEGSLIGSDFKILTPLALRKWLDTIPGRKVVIVDACCSGMLISDDVSVATLHLSDDFNTSFLSAFQSSARGALNADCYFVATAAGPRELSMEGTIYSGSSSKIMGFFTYALCQGLGWDGVTSRGGAWLADTDGDRAVSIPEAAAYARSVALTLNSSQTAMWWPLDSGWFAPFRQ